MIPVVSKPLEACALTTTCSGCCDLHTQFLVLLFNYVLSPLHAGPPSGAGDVGGDLSFQLAGAGRVVAANAARRTRYPEAQCPCLTAEPSTGTRFHREAHRTVVSIYFRLGLELRTSGLPAGSKKVVLTRRRP